MDHRQVYEALMRKAVGRGGLDGYVERHHIRPKAIYPDQKDDPENIVALTAREHFVAHLLLAKIYGGRMVFAAYSMSNHGRYGGRRYEWLRREAAAQLSLDRTGEGNPQYGRKASAETLEKLSAARRAYYAENDHATKGRTKSPEARARMRFLSGEDHPNFGTTRSEVTKARISESKKGVPNPFAAKPLSKETKEKIRVANTGKIVPEERRQRISAALKGRPKPPRTEEHRRKIAEANRRRSVRP